ncbi:hypothetical protein SAMD00019534_046110 [Acytostelium subglobosum LB1]|uniref:hypothetical protein n=1 Tax=Acytostelium subglobosum LB1 TaxID=1410327 RepID=UPI00064516CE|nr:hypothetical protein SAMD00019534_046110 [Acytostelium subglobosum LB1]GAM21436.1 hypothetical protein SAMD00019534_046110 [Acytostelium subglobosum LB1]|eukprot:XP_012755555.1 hypothetical protein SAMD00019534_046110 [Acytostelium subglobosum LB1]
MFGILLLLVVVVVVVVLFMFMFMFVVVLLLSSLPPLVLLANEVAMSRSVRRLGSGGVVPLR